MKKIFFIASLFILMSLTLDAWSQSKSGSRTLRGKKTKPGKTVYDFEEVDILGKLKKPEGQSIVEPPEFQFRRLLDLDESFLPNIIRSVDEF